jgi:hypothetical protein
VETCPPTSGSVEAQMPSHPSSLPGPLVVSAVSLLVLSLLNDGFHVAHRRSNPLTHYTYSCLHASSSAPHPVASRILASPAMLSYWSQRVGLRTYPRVALFQAPPCEGAHGAFLFRARPEAYCLCATRGVRFGLSH